MSIGILLSFTRDCATALLARIPDGIANLDPGPIKFLLLNVYRYTLMTIGLLIALSRLALNVVTFELYEHYFLGRTDFIIQLISLYRSYTAYVYNRTEFGPNLVSQASLKEFIVHLELTSAYMIIMLLVMLISPQRQVSWPALRATADDTICSFVDEALLAGLRSPRPSMISCAVASNAVNAVIDSPTVRAMIPLCLDPWLRNLLRAILIGSYRALKCAILRTPGFSVSYIIMYAAGSILHLTYHAIGQIQDLIFIRAERVSFGKDDSDLESLKDLDVNLGSAPYQSHLHSSVQSQSMNVPATLELVDERSLVDARVAITSSEHTVNNHHID